MKRFMMLAVVMTSFALAACGPGEMGPPGPAGPPGAQGPQGPKGDPGVSISSTRYCSASGSAPWGPTVLSYQQTTFADGSFYVSCEVALSDLSVSSSQFFKKGATPGCLLVSDVDTPSFGYWSFALEGTGLVPFATYNDTSSSYNGTKYGLPCQ